MESNQNFGELSWPTDFGLDGLVSGHTKNTADFLQCRFLVAGRRMFQSPLRDSF